MGNRVISDDLWDALRTLILGVHTGDRIAARSAGRLAAASDYDLSFQYNRAVQYMAYATISRRIGHRPLLVQDAEDTLNRLRPAIRSLGVAATDIEILNAIKMAILLPPEPWFDPDDARMSRRLVGSWAILVGLCLEGPEEFESLRSGVDRWLDMQADTA